MNKLIYKRLYMINLFHKYKYNIYQNTNQKNFKSLFFDVCKSTSLQIDRYSFNALKFEKTSDMYL